MNDATPTQTSEALVTFVTRTQLSTIINFSKRHVDELTKRGVIPFLKVGKSVRYDVAEVLAVMRERFHVRAKPLKQSRKAKSTTAITE